MYDEFEPSCRWIKEEVHETLEIDLKRIKISCLFVLVWITLYYANCILRVNLLSFFQKPLMAWIEKNLLDEVQTLKGMKWSLIFVTACSLAWYSRNLAIFEITLMLTPILIAGFGSWPETMIRTSNWFKEPK